MFYLILSMSMFSSLLACTFQGTILQYPLVILAGGLLLLSLPFSPAFYKEDTVVKKYVPDVNVPLRDKHGRFVKGHKPHNKK